MTQADLQADEFKVVARVLGHGGYAAWRQPPPGHKAKSVFGLLHSGRWCATLGELETGATDPDLARFWGGTLKRMRKLGLNDVERRAMVEQLRAKGVPLPEQPTWPRSTEPQWVEVAEELAALIRDQDLAACDRASDLHRGRLGERGHRYRVT